MISKCSLNLWEMYWIFCLTSFLSLISFKLNVNHINFFPLRACHNFTLFFFFFVRWFLRRFAIPNTRTIFYIALQVTSTWYCQDTARLCNLCWEKCSLFALLWEHQEGSNKENIFHSQLFISSLRYLSYPQFGE